MLNSEENEKKESESTEEIETDSKAEESSEDESKPEADKSVSEEKMEDDYEPIDDFDDFDIEKKPEKQEENIQEAETVTEKTKKELRAEKREQRLAERAKRREEREKEKAEEAAAEPKETEEERAARIEKRNARIKMILKKVGITAAVLAIIYFAGVLFYTSHFFFGTGIGNYNCSNMSLKKAEEHITTGIQNYTFTVYDKNGEGEKITGEEVGLAAEAMEDINDIKAKQNPFGWPLFWYGRDIPMDIQIALDEQKLRDKISGLKCVQESKQQMDGAAAGIYYDESDGTYKVKDDGTHEIISENMMYDKISAGMTGLNPDMTLDTEGCYLGLAGDDTMNDTLWKLNCYVGATITYQFGDETKVLDKGTINTWLSVDENYNIDLSVEGVASYVYNLAAEYNTVGSERTFNSSASGEPVTVSGGDYGWEIDVSQETDALYNSILAGVPETREPIYKRTAGSRGQNNDFPNTYVEVSLAAQHLWYYKDGQLILSSDVVTGNPLQGNGTHTGVFRLKYKEKDATLVGEDYETPVSYWMPFNGGEGLHDAPWRGVFGGQIYMGGGSHGCVNCPVDTARTLFENLQSGDPVIVY